MAKEQVKAILWRLVNVATIDTLNGTSPGQYDIRLGANSLIGDFFENLPREDRTANDGYTLNVPIQNLEGEKPIPQENLGVRFMGDLSTRKDYNIPSQRPASAYPLWRLDRAVPGIAPDDLKKQKHYIIIIKDTNLNYHCRWITPEDLEELPKELKEEIERSEIGCKEFLKVAYSDQSIDIYKQLLRHHNVLLYGPPGTGKSHIMQEVMSLFTKGKTYYIDTEKEHNSINLLTSSSTSTVTDWVTFHQSYSYEEFIIGLKTNPKSDKMLSLEPSPGLLLELSEFARQSKSSALLAIDEINRGNVSRIFGEFITLLESDKRLDENNNEHFGTVKIRLPYIKQNEPLDIILKNGSSIKLSNPFTMPYRVFILASMNSIDKSTTPLDAALRRRFHIIDLGPSLTILAKALNIKMPNLKLDPTLTEEAISVDEVKALSIYLMNYLNTIISQFIGPEFRFGHWYFKRLCNNFSDSSHAISVLTDIWQNQLYPQLEELFNGRIDQLEYILRLEKYKGITPIRSIKPTEEMSEMGAFNALEKININGIDLIKYLKYLVSNDVVK